jgi:nucleotide-binding universal stress UspA family protein
MSGPVAIIIWLCIVIVSATIVVYLARRWGHDPFGWALLAAVMGPIALVALAGTHQSDRATRPHERMIRPRSTSGPLLVAVDGSQAADALVQHAIDVWQGGDVVVLHVVPYELQPQGPEDDISIRTARDATERVTAALQRAGIPARLEVRYGIPGEAVVSCADELNARLILVGRRGSGLARTLLGSTSQYVVEHATRPVAVAG